MILCAACNDDPDSGAAIRQDSDVRCHACRSSEPPFYHRPVLVCCLACHSEDREPRFATNHGHMTGTRTPAEPFGVCMAQHLRRNQLRYGINHAKTADELRGYYDRAWLVWRYTPRPAPRHAEDLVLIQARIRMAELERLVQPPTEHHDVPDSEEVALW